MVKRYFKFFVSYHRFKFQPELFKMRLIFLYLEQIIFIMSKIYRILSLFLVVSCTICTGNPEPDTNKKAEWIAQTFQNIKNQTFPRIKAVSWWHERWENEDGSISDLRINSSPESLEAFRTSINDDYYQTTAQFNQNKLLPPAQGVYFAAFPDFGGPEDEVTQQRINDFETLAQKQITWAYFSNNWYHNIIFPSAAVQIIHQAGRIPFIRIMARTTLDENVADTNYSMQNIIDGNFDNDLLQWFQEAANTGFPLLIEFGTEVNGEWFPWNGIYNGGGTTTNYGDPNLPDGPERFRDAYRHIIDLSRQAGATNLTWFFHIDAAGQPEETWNNFENYYPGDNYIDWIGVSVYGAVTPDEPPMNFADKLNLVYDRICTLTNKPLAILETGIVE